MACFLELLLLTSGALVNGGHVLPPVDKASRDVIFVVMIKLLLDTLTIPNVEEQHLLVFVGALYLHVHRYLTV